jgi:glycolate oxidase iron-sulfur subunit
VFEPILERKILLPELPSYEDLLLCIRCGRCLPVCPTYQETVQETFSPRGRLSLLRAVEDGRLEFTRAVLDHLYHCLDCRACNAICPAKVTIGQCIVAGRAAYAGLHGRPWWANLAFRNVLVSARRLELFLPLARFYQRSGLWRVARPLLSLLPGRLRTLAFMERLLPPLPARPLHETVAEVTPALGGRKHRVGFFLGCFMSQLFADVSESTIAVLTRAGCEVVTPAGQMCCGAPHEDQADPEMARKLARHNVDLFAKYADLEVIVTDCAACAGMCKSYSHLLRGDPEYADEARAFSARIRDISEWLAAIMPDDAPLEPVRKKVTYHEPCHLSNLQGIRIPPRQLLKRVPGLELIEMDDPTACCGSAGIYNITHPEMAMKRLQRKMGAIAATGVGTVVTGNPGCLLQLRYGAEALGPRVEVLHLTQILAAAWRSDGR